MPRFRRLEAEAVAVEFNAPAVQLPCGINQRAVEQIAITIQIINGYKILSHTLGKAGLGLLAVAAEKRGSRRVT